MHQNPQHDFIVVTTIALIIVQHMERDIVINPIITDGANVLHNISSSLVFVIIF